MDTALCLTAFLQGKCFWNEVSVISVFGVNSTTRGCKSSAKSLWLSVVMQGPFC